MNKKQGDMPLIDCTYKVRKPNGDIVEVNRFDMNLTMCVNPESWIQCSDTSWISANRLVIMRLAGGILTTTASSISAISTSSDCQNESDYIQKT